MKVLDPTTLSAAELDAQGVTLTGYHEPATSGAVWQTHSEYLTAHPKVDQVQRSEARRSAMVHLGGHDSLAGLRLPRAFPCLGRFRIVDDDGRRPAVVVCDRCGWRLGVQQAALSGEAKQEAAW